MLPRRSLLLGSSFAFASPATYHLSLLRSEVSFQPPSGTRIPFGWKAFRLEKPTILGFKALIRPAEPSRFRLSVALDSAEPSKVEVYLPLGNWEPAVMDIRFPGAFEIFEVELDPEATQAALKGGVGLRRIEGSAPLMFFAPDPTGDTTPSELQPHLMVAGNETRRREFDARLVSGADLQPWGWKLGCVLDGLLDLEKPLGRKSRQAFDRWLKLFFPSGALVYEGLGNVPRDGGIDSAEAVLPFAALARRDPRHPSLTMAAAWCRKNADVSGVILDRDSVLDTSGCYTVAYPLAVLSSALKDSQLARLSENQLLARQRKLAEAGAIYTRGAGGQTRLKNWSRGIAWYLLGHVRSLAYLPRTAGLEDAVRQAASLALRTQRPDGLWACFAGEEETGVETSGSAGIAAALALGARLKILGPEALAASRRTASALERFLTPDGFLSAVAPDARAGETVLRGGYRCHGQFAAGLYAQLLGAIA